jgi:hypothetical protein
MRLLRAAAGIGCLLSIIACDEAEKQQRTESQRAEDKTEVARLTDPAYGTAEVEQRLRRRITVRDNIIIIRAASLADDVQAVRASTPWIVTCGRLGLYVTFGGGGYDNSGPSTTLSEAELSQAECETISFSVGLALNEILKNQ